jgi:hypothetical protein
VIHHIVPADDLNDWSCAWHCSAKWISEEDMAAIAAKEVELQFA